MVQKCFDITIIGGLENSGGGVGEIETIIFFAKHVSFINLCEL